MAKTMNQFVEEIAKRAGELAEMQMDDLRAEYPEETDTRGELVAYCKRCEFSKAEIIEAILHEEFDLEFDQEIDL